MELGNSRLPINNSQREDNGPSFAKAIEGRRGWSWAGVVVLVVAHFLVLGSRELGAAEGDERGTLKKWLEAQSGLKTWSADLVQTRQLKTLAQPLVSTGKVWFAAPNRFRWEIGSPAQTIAARSGDEMLVVYPRLKRVERYRLGGEQMGQWKDTLALLEAGFPRSEADLTRQFNVAGVSSTNGVTWVMLQPKSASARRMMPQIVVGFSQGDYQLRGTELHFADGSVMRNEFRNGKVNPPVDPGVFEVKVGEGFKVVEPMKR